MFESVEIVARAGDGGNGVVSFRRESFVPRGGPDGGEGGKGGNVVIVADGSISNLGKHRQKQVYRAERGGNGEGKRKHGKNGADLVIRVPVGTVVLEAGEGKLIEDLEKEGQEVVVARGGKGGWGNAHYASATQQTPRIAQKGEQGEERAVVLELRLIADVGIVGYPNVGKSSLLAAVSDAKPKIAEYPFTTIEPVLGVVTVGERCFVLAEIPGLVEDAHMGRGLGHEFVTHVLRTRVLLHLVDGTSNSAVEDMLKVNRELALYNSEMERKQQVVAVNKVDLEEVKARVTEMREAFEGAGIDVMFVSAATGEGVVQLMKKVDQVLREEKTRAEVEKKEIENVLQPRPRRSRPRIEKRGDVFVVDMPEMARLVEGADISKYEVRSQLRRELAKRGVRQALEEAGAKPGDKISCGEMEWEL